MSEPISLILEFARAKEAADPYAFHFSPQEYLLRSASGGIESATLAWDEGLLADLGVELTERGNVARSNDFETSVEGVFVAGDMGRGQSLIVWAIAEGRAAAAAVDRFLMGESALPAPIKPTAAPQR